MNKIIKIGIVILVIIIFSFLAVENFKRIKIDLQFCNLHGSGGFYCKTICNFSGGKVTEQDDCPVVCGTNFCTPNCDLGKREVYTCQGGFFKDSIIPGEINFENK